MNEELLLKLYNKYNLSQKGDFKTFVSDMQNLEVAEGFYNRFLAKDNKGTVEQFVNDIGVEYVPTPARVPKTQTQKLQDASSKLNQANANLNTATAKLRGADRVQPPSFDEYVPEDITKTPIQPQEDISYEQEPPKRAASPLGYSWGTPAEGAATIITPSRAEQIRSEQEPVTGKLDLESYQNLGQFKDYQKLEQKIADYEKASEEAETSITDVVVDFGKAVFGAMDPRTNFFDTYRQINDANKAKAEEAKKAADSAKANAYLSIPVEYFSPITFDEAYEVESYEATTKEEAVRKAFIKMQKHLNRLDEALSAHLQILPEGERNMAIDLINGKAIDLKKEPSLQLQKVASLIESYKTTKSQINANVKPYENYVKDVTRLIGTYKDKGLSGDEIKEKVVNYLETLKVASPGYEAEKVQDIINIVQDETFVGGSIDQVPRSIMKTTVDKLIGSGEAFVKTAKSMFSPDAAFDLVADDKEKIQLERVESAISRAAMEPASKYSGSISEEVVKKGDITLVVSNDKVVDMRNADGSRIYFPTKEQEEIAKSFNPEVDKTEKDYRGMSILTNTSQVVFDMLPTIAVSALSGGTSTAVMLGTMLPVYGDYYNQALETTGDPRKSAIYAGLTSFAIGYFEQKFGNLEARLGRTLSGAEKRGLYDAVTKTAAEVADSGIESYVKGPGFLKRVQNTLNKSTEIGKDVIKEVATEILNFPIEAAAGQISGVKTEVPTGEEVQETVILTTFASMFMSGANVALNAKNDINELIAFAAQRPEKFNQVADQWINSAPNEEIKNKRKADIEAKKLALEEVQDTFSYIQENNFDSKSKDKLTKLTLDKARALHKLNTSTSQKTKAVLQKEINDINVQMAAITPSAEPEVTPTPTQAEAVTAKAEEPKAKTFIGRDLTGGKKVYTDFDNTLYNPRSRELTALGEELRAKLNSGELTPEDVEILTARSADEAEVVRRLFPELTITSGLSPEGKAAKIREAGGNSIFIDDNKENLQAANIGEVIDAKTVVPQVPKEVEAEKIAAKAEEEAFPVQKAAPAAAITPTAPAITVTPTAPAEGLTKEQQADLDKINKRAERIQRTLQEDTAVQEDGDEPLLPPAERQKLETELQTLNQKKDAIQKQSTTEIPVQPGTKGRQGVGGQVQAKPQGPARESEKAKAEVKAEEPTAKEVEAKKVDIERRRQEELERRKNKIEVSRTEYTDSEGNVYTVREFEDGHAEFWLTPVGSTMPQNISSDSSNIYTKEYLEDISDGPLSEGKSVEPKRNLVNKINAKYDAEVADLEEAPQATKKPQPKVESTKAEKVSPRAPQTVTEANTIEGFEPTNRKGEKIVGRVFTKEEDGTWKARVRNKNGKLSSGSNVNIPSVVEQLEKELEKRTTTSKPPVEVKAVEEKPSTKAAQETKKQISTKDVKLKKGEDFDNDRVYEVTYEGETIGRIYYDRSLHNSWLDADYTRTDAKDIFGDVLGTKEEALQAMVDRWNSKQEETPTEVKKEPTKVEEPAEAEEMFFEQKLPNKTIKRPVEVRDGKWYSISQEATLEGDIEKQLDEKYPGVREGKVKLTETKTTEGAKDTPTTTEKAPKTILEKLGTSEKAVKAQIKKFFTDNIPGITPEQSQKLADANYIMWRAVANTLSPGKALQFMRRKVAQLGIISTEAQAQEMSARIGGDLKFSSEGIKLLSDTNFSPKLLNSLLTRLKSRGDDFAFEVISAIKNKDNNFDSGESELNEVISDIIDREPSFKDIVQILKSTSNDLESSSTKDIINYLQSIGDPEIGRIAKELVKFQQDADPTTLPQVSENIVNNAIEHLESFNKKGLELLRGTNDKESRKNIQQTIQENKKTIDHLKRMKKDPKFSVDSLNNRAFNSYSKLKDNFFGGLEANNNRLFFADATNGFSYRGDMRADIVLYTSDGASFWLNEGADGYVIIEDFQVSADKLGTGVGSSALSNLLKYADDNGITLIGEPLAQTERGRGDKKGLSQKNLIDFYKRNGFKKISKDTLNKNRNSEDVFLERPPAKNKKSVQFQQEAAKFRGAAIALANGQHIVAALESPMPTTFAHEAIFHATIEEGVFTPEEKQSFIDEYNNAFGDTATDWNTDVSEYTARVYEKYLSNGRKLTEAEVKDEKRRGILQKAFDTFTGLMKELYNAVIEYTNTKGTTKTISLSPQAQAIFDRVTGIEPIAKVQEPSVIAKAGETKRPRIPTKPKSEIDASLKDAEQKLKESAKEFLKAFAIGDNKIGIIFDPKAAAISRATAAKNFFGAIVDYVKAKVAAGKYNAAMFLADVKAGKLGDIEISQAGADYIFDEVLDPGKNREQVKVVEQLRQEIENLYEQFENDSANLDQFEQRVQDIFTDLAKQQKNTRGTNFFFSPSDVKNLLKKASKVATEEDLNEFNEMLESILEDKRIRKFKEKVDRNRSLAKKRVKALKTTDNDLKNAISFNSRDRSFQTEDAKNNYQDLNRFNSFLEAVNNPAIAKDKKFLEDKEYFAKKYRGQLEKAAAKRAIKKAEFDKDGNLIEDGEIITPYEKLPKKYKDEFNSRQMKFDEDGNLINDQGKIITPVAELSKKEKAELSKRRTAQNKLKRKAESQKGDAELKESLVEEAQELQKGSRPIHIDSTIQSLSDSFFSLSNSDLQSLSTSDLATLISGFKSLRDAGILQDTYEALLSKAKQEGVVNKSVSVLENSSGSFRKLLRDIITFATARGKSAQDLSERFIKNTPLRRVDAIFKGKDGTYFYDTFLNPLAIGFGKFSSFNSRLKNELRDLSKNVSQKDSLKLMLYAIDKQYKNNPDSDELNSIEEEIANAMANQDENYKVGDFKIVKEIYDELLAEMGGVFDYRKMDAATSGPLAIKPNERKLIEYIEKLNDSQVGKIMATASRTGRDTKIYKNYTPLDRVSSKTIGNIMRDFVEETIDADTYQLDSPVVPGNVNARVKNQNAIRNWNYVTSNYNSAKKTELDYEVRQRLKDFGNYTKALVESLDAKMNEAKENGNKVQQDQYKAYKDFVSAMRKVTKEVSRDNFVASFDELSDTERVLNFASELGYAATLASVPRSGTEVISNIWFAMTAYPIELLSGMNYMMSNRDFSGVNSDLDKFISLVPTAQSSRLLDHQGSLYRDQVRETKGFGATSGVRAASRILETYADRVSGFNNFLNSFGDKIIAKPMWFGSFENEFNRLKKKEGSNEKFDIKRFIADEQYRFENTNIIAEATKVADYNLAQGFSSFNPFESIADLNLHAKAGILETFKRFLQRFIRFEYQSAEDAISAMVGRGSMSRGKGLQLMIATVGRMTLYTMLARALGDWFDEALVQPAVNAVSKTFTGEDLLISPEGEEEDWEEKIKTSLLGSIISLTLARRLNGLQKVPINFGVEVLNASFGDDLGLRKTEAYEAYNNSLVFSQLKIPNIEGFGDEVLFSAFGRDFNKPIVKDMNIEKYLLRTMFAFSGPYNPLLTNTSDFILDTTRSLNKDLQFLEEINPYKFDAVTESLPWFAGANLFTTLVPVPAPRDIKRNLQNLKSAIQFGPEVNDPVYKKAMKEGATLKEQRDGLDKLTDIRKEQVEKMEDAYIEFLESDEWTTILEESKEKAGSSSKFTAKFLSSKGKYLPERTYYKRGDSWFYQEQDDEKQVRSEDLVYQLDNYSDKAAYRYAWERFMIEMHKKSFLYQVEPKEISVGEFEFVPRGYKGTKLEQKYGKIAPMQGTTRFTINRYFN